jgi:hypothetical protein
LDRQENSTARQPATRCNTRKVEYLSAEGPAPHVAFVVMKTKGPPMADNTKDDAISHEMKQVAIAIFGEHLTVKTADGHVALERVCTAIAELIWPGDTDHATATRKRFFGICFTHVQILHEDTKVLASFEE